MKSLYIVLLAVAICTISCRAKQGDPGPAGTTGTTGANGTTGADGTGTLDKQGFITGTLAYVDYKDSAVSIPFTYEYITSLEDSEYEISTDDGTSYSINALTRVDAKDFEKYLSFTFSGSYDQNGKIQTPDGGSIDLSYVGKINENLFEFSGSSSFNNVDTETTCDYTNFNLDTLTGRLTFGYILTYSANYINSDDRYDDNTTATVTGSVDVILNRKKLPKVISVP